MKRSKQGDLRKKKEYLVQLTSENRAYFERGVRVTSRGDGGKSVCQYRNSSAKCEDIKITLSLRFAVCNVSL
jgi:hypothetical protein